MKYYIIEMKLNLLFSYNSQLKRSREMMEQATV